MAERHSLLHAIIEYVNLRHVIYRKDLVDHFRNNYSVSTISTYLNLLRANNFIYRRSRGIYGRELGKYIDTNLTESQLRLIYKQTT